MVILGIPIAAYSRGRLMSQVGWRGLRDYLQSSLLACIRLGC